MFHDQTGSSYECDSVLQLMLVASSNLSIPREEYSQEPSAGDRKKRHWVPSTFLARATLETGGHAHLCLIKRFPKAADIQSRATLSQRDKHGQESNHNKDDAGQLHLFVE